MHWMTGSTKHVTATLASRTVGCATRVESQTCEVGGRPASVVLAGQ